MIIFSQPAEKLKSDLESFYNFSPPRALDLGRGRDPDRGNGGLDEPFRPWDLDARTPAPLLSPYYCQHCQHNRNHTSKPRPGLLLPLPFSPCGKEKNGLIRGVRGAEPTALVTLPSLLVLSNNCVLKGEFDEFTCLD